METPSPFTRGNRKMARGVVANPFAHAPRPGTAADTALGRRIGFWVLLGLLGFGLGAALVKLQLLLVVGALIALLCVVIVLAKPYVGLLVYTILFVLRPGELWPLLGTLHLERIVGTLTLASLFLSQYLSERHLVIDRSRQTHLLLLFVCAVAMSVPFATWRMLAVDGLMEILRIVGYYIMVAHLVDTRARLRWFIGTFCLLITFVAVSSLYEYFAGGSFFAQGIDRAVALTSFGNNPNELGTTLASALPIFLLGAFHRPLRAGRWLLATIGLAMLVTIVFTGSRASILGLLAGLVWLWWRSRNRLLVGAFGLCLLLVAFTLMPQQYKTRYSTITHSELDGSSKSRVTAWVAGLNMLIDRPLFGVGIRCYGTAHATHYSPAGTQDWLEAHSLYLQVLGELGLVGTFIFFSFIVEMLRLNRATAQRLRGSPDDWAFEITMLDALFAGIVVLLLSGVFGHSLLRRTWYVFAATGLAILRTQVCLGEVASASPDLDRPAPAMLHEELEPA